MPRAILLLTLVLAAAPTAASATTIFKCKDENGKIYYSQSFDREKCSGGGAELNERGMAVREIERRKTPEEQAAEKAAAEAAAEIERLRAAQQQADRVLMMSYASEEDLQRSNAQELEVIESSTQTGRLQMARYERQLADLLAQAADVERSGQAVPAELVSRIDQVRGLIEEQRAFTTRKLAEQAQSHLEFTMRLIRYREMKARQQALIQGDTDT
jgi:hypothetical protein